MKFVVQRPNLWSEHSAFGSLPFVAPLPPAMVPSFCPQASILAAQPRLRTKFVELSYSVQEKMFSQLTVYVGGFWCNSGPLEGPLATPTTTSKEGERCPVQVHGGRLVVSISISDQLILYSVCTDKKRTTHPLLILLLPPLPFVPSLRSNIPCFLTSFHHHHHHRLMSKKSIMALPSFETLRSFPLTLSPSTVSMLITSSSSSPPMCMISNTSGVPPMTPFDAPTSMRHALPPNAELILRCGV